MRKDSKIELIKGVPLFEHCSARELSRIASVANEYNIPAGGTLAGQGTRGSEFMVIVDGAAEDEPLTVIVGPLASDASASAHAFTGANGLAG